MNPQNEQATRPELKPWCLMPSLVFGGAVNTLCIDIGGTNLKALVVDATGKATGQTVKSRTPARSDPEQLLAALAGLWRRLGPFDRVAVGFPGVVDKGVTINAPNLYEDYQFPP